MLVPGLERPAFAVLPQLSSVRVGPALIISGTSAALQLGRESRALAEQDRLEEALTKAEDALALARAEFGERDAHVAFILDDLATLSYRLGRFAKALGHAEQAVAIIETARGRQSPDYALLVNNQATILTALGRLAEAVPLYERADAILLAELGAAHESTVLTARSLGIAYSEMSQPEKARGYFERAVQAEQALHGERSLEFARALLDRAGIDLELEAPDQARARAEQALAIARAGPGRDARAGPGGRHAGAR
jgi:tetratricopeptide (TPR) repeat protein